MSFKYSLKHLAINSLSSYALDFFARKYYAQNVSVFMLHRFKTDLVHDYEHTSEQLGSALELLRKKRFHFLSLDEAAFYLIEGRPFPQKSVVFTIDDGYFDQLEVSVPVFAKYDCPATYFVVTDFIDQKIWMWDSKVHYLYSKVVHDDFVSAAKVVIGFELNRESKYSIAMQVIFVLTKLPISQIDQKLAQLAKHLDIELPLLPVPEYRAATWDCLKEAINSGMHIGAHTLSHPLLSKETEFDAFEQIRCSSERLADELDNYSKVFCYPVGRSVDFGEREKTLAKQCGFGSAVSAMPGRANKNADLYSLPRFGLPDSHLDLLQYASWIERAKEKLTQ